MNSRRKFIVQSGLTTAALVAAKPYDSLASITHNLTGQPLHQVTLLHTTSTKEGVISRMQQLANNHHNPVFLHAGKNASGNFDVTAASLTEHFEGAYTIMTKGPVRIGVMEATPKGFDSIEKVNQLASFLKQEQNCDMVVCLSQLGYSNRIAVDDARLAASSEHIDVIIGKETAASPRQPLIAQNKNKSEVMLHYSDDQKAAIGKINIAFNKQCHKNKIAFDHPFKPKK